MKNQSSRIENLKNRGTQKEMDMGNIEGLSPSENERRVNEELAEIAREDALYNAQFIENLDGPSTSRTNGKYFLHNANQLLG